MKNNLYKPGYIDFTNEKMFFGKGKNILRFDVEKYPIFNKINNKMLSFYWRPEEIDLTKDRSDIREDMEEHENFIITRTIQKIEFLDSIMGRGPMLTFGQLVSIPELENAILTWDFFEGAIHARSYSTILQEAYPDPSVVFDEVHDIKELQDIANFVSSYYNDFYEKIIEFQYDDLKGNKRSKETELEFKKSFLKLLMVVNCLEGIQFLSSFATTWSLTETKGVMAGTSKILQLIARDELCHLELTENINMLLRDNPDEGFSELWDELKNDFYEIFWKVTELEFAWTEHIFSKGSLISMNKDICDNYIKFVCNNRLVTLGLKPIYPDVMINPLPWIEKWYLQGSTSGALQELESTDYKIGGIEFNESDDIYDMF